MSRHGYIQSFWLRKQKPGGWLGCGWCSIFKKDIRVSTEQGRPIFSVPTKSTSCDPRDHHCVDLITDSNSDIWLMCILWALFFSCIFTSFRPCPMRFFSRAELLSLSKPGLDSWELAQFLESGLRQIRTTTGLRFCSVFTWQSCFRKIHYFSIFRKCWNAHQHMGIRFICAVCHKWI